MSQDLTSRGASIVTQSGLPFFPMSPRPEDVRIDDIAHALSHQCRFAGHTREFYSVAQHSVLVSHACDPADALWGLLHDASEAYLSDIVHPVKRSELMGGYRELEAAVMWAVCRRFRLPLKLPRSVDGADLALLLTEARDLMPTPLEMIPPNCAPLAMTIRPVSARDAKQQFIARFMELTAGGRS